MGKADGASAETTRPKREVTIRDLLTHTAGIGSISDPNRSLKDHVAELARVPLGFEPGTSWAYSNGSSDVLARFIEVLSNESLDVVLRKRIFEPLGMKNTWLSLPAAARERFAVPYRSVKGVLTAESGGNIDGSRGLRGSTGLFSTAGDYLLFCRMLLNRGELGNVILLSPKTVELMTTSHIGTLPMFDWLPEYGFGLGFRVLTDADSCGCTPVYIECLVR